MNKSGKARKKRKRKKKKKNVEMAEEMKGELGGWGYHCGGVWWVRANRVELTRKVLETRAFFLRWLRFSRLVKTI